MAGISFWRFRIHLSRYLWHGCFIPSPLELLCCISSLQRDIICREEDRNAISQMERFHPVGWKGYPGNGRNDLWVDSRNAASRSDQIWNLIGLIFWNGRDIINLDIFASRKGLSGYPSRCHQEAAQMIARNKRRKDKKE